MSDKDILINNYVPNPPDKRGKWLNNNDHDSFQFIVSEAAIGGGVSANTGCPTPIAEAARKKAENKYYDKQLKTPQEIIKKNIA